MRSNDKIIPCLNAGGLSDTEIREKLIAKYSSY